MSNNKVIFSLLFFLSLATSSRGQDANVKSGNKLTAYIGGGISFYQGTPGTPSGLEATVTRIKPAATLRVMWKPDFLLRLGLESGLVQFYSYKIDDNGIKSSTSVEAVPLLLVFSMPVTRKLNLYSGTGYYVMRSVLIYDGKVTTTGLSLGWMLAAAYDFPISSTLGINTEIKWHKAVPTRDGSLNAQVQLRWDFLRK
ncbi:MAG: hypothetical protein V4725_11845 [Bacteroidota bacterium]|nr:hypothetical protein [Ferruginibacter sp.]